jgi:Chaperone for flagella basal body P-ring formation
MKCSSSSITWASSGSRVTWIMTRSNSVRRLTLCVIALGSMFPPEAWSADIPAQEYRPPAGPLFTPVTRTEVWQAVDAALRRQGISDEDLPKEEDLDLPVILPALAGRTLRVASVCWDERPQRTQFRLQCSEPGQCLPFLVYISKASLANAIGRAPSCRMAGRSRSGLGSSLAPEVAPKPAVRIGEEATAIFVSGGLRMTASVTCLERGRAGEVIRVRGEDGHVFRARVSGPARLEALPQ